MSRKLRVIASPDKQFIEYGDREWSTKIVKLLEDTCNTPLRSKGFPLQLNDYEPRKKGIEVKF